MPMRLARGEIEYILQADHSERTGPPGWLRSHSRKNTLP